MVTISRETSAQIEARLRGVYRECSIEWLAGLWSFVEGADAVHRADSIADIRDEGQLSALCPAVDADERFAVFRVVLPPDSDDSGFVGWLSSRIKAATGSGLFVICGHNRERGGVFDYYGVPEAIGDEARELLDRLTRTDAFDGVVMRATQTAGDSGIGPETVFCFTQDGTTISARYGGGRIAEGWLVGTLDASQVRFDYVQVQVDGVVDSGRSVGEVSRLPDGRWRLTEHFTWSSRDGGGTNHLEE
ncbi:DUF6196 family protein [Saccharopolyspora sp. NPDC050389]|uniref:DUF6196 family protein n=1 Tax=Saccharopolyspora sp. NPDC050389 TaxID=3155516 RepID=UPI0033D48F62